MHARHHMSGGVLCLAGSYLHLGPKQIDQRIVGIIPKCIPAKVQIAIHIWLCGKFRQDRACITKYPNCLHTWEEVSIPHNIERGQGKSAYP